MRKLCLILNPQVTISTSVHPRTKIKYAVVKAYWIDGDGNLKRSVNRNVGVEDWKLAELASKMFSTVGFESHLEARNINNGTRADMLISKNNKSCVVEIKADDRDSFIKTFISLELWKEYKKEYQL